MQLHTVCNVKHHKVFTVHAFIHSYTVLGPLWVQEAQIHKCALIGFRVVIKTQLNICVFLKDKLVEISIAGWGV
jgi:hypothetical protein